MSVARNILTHQLNSSQPNNSQPNNSQLNNPQLNTSDLTHLTINCRLPGGYQLAHHPDWNAWLIVSPTNEVILADEAGKPFQTTGDTFRYINRQRQRPSGPAATVATAVEATFDRNHQLMALGEQIDPERASVIDRWTGRLEALVGGVADLTRVLAGIRCTPPADVEAKPLLDAMERLQDLIDAITGELEQSPAAELIEAATGRCEAAVWIERRLQNGAWADEPDAPARWLVEVEATIKMNPEEAERLTAVYQSRFGGGSEISAEPSRVAVTTDAAADSVNGGPTTTRRNFLKGLTSLIGIAAAGALGGVRAVQAAESPTANPATRLTQPQAHQPQAAAHQTSLSAPKPQTDPEARQEAAGQALDPARYALITGWIERLYEPMIALENLQELLFEARHTHPDVVDGVALDNAGQAVYLAFRQLLAEVDGPEFDEMLLSAVSGRTSVWTLFVEGLMAKPESILAEIKTIRERWPADADYLMGLYQARFGGAA